MTPEPSSPVAVCPQCGTQIAAALLVCPVCRRLTHADRLNELARQAAAAAEARDVSGELGLWREALDLLPVDTRQYADIAKKVADLSARVDAGEAVPRRPAGKGGSKAAAGLGVVGLLLWKFKVVLLFVLTKAKLLVLGLTKASTLFSMILSLGVYWAAWGWKFALGLVLSIYVHEMGHVAMLRRYGVKATAPMFIPGVGAFVRLRQHPASVAEDARIGLAGPVWGLGAALVAWLVSIVMQWPSWAAIARVGAWINLFNLVPIWQLDGGRAFGALSRAQRWATILIIGAVWYQVQEGMLLLMGIFAILHGIAANPPAKPDHVIGIEYAALVIVLSLMCLIPVPV